MRHSVLALTVPFAFALPCAAQKSTVSPPFVDNVYTGAHNGIPFGGYQSPEQLYQQVDEGLVGRRLVINGMAFSHSWSADYAARQFTMEVSIGDAATTASTISDTYAANFSGSPTVVFKGTLNWPFRARGFDLPGPFDSEIPFSNPWSYSGTKPICWETYISAYSGYTNGDADQFYLMGYTRSTSTLRPKYWAGKIGTGCVRPNGTLSDHPLTSQGFVDSNAQQVKDYMIFGPPNAPAVLKFGLPSTTAFGQPLPLSLGFIGVRPGCDLYIAPLIDLFAGTTDASGRVEFTVPFTYTAALGGINFRTQWFTFDANRTGITAVSNGLNHAVPLDGVTKQWPVARNWGTTFGTTKPATSTGRPNGSNNQRSGFNEPNYGLTVLYRHF